MGKKTRQRKKTRRRRRRRKTRKRGGNIPWTPRPAIRELTDEQKERVKNLTPDQRKMLLSCSVYLKKWNKLYRHTGRRFRHPKIYQIVRKCRKLFKQ